MQLSTSIIFGTLRSLTEATVGISLCLMKLRLDLLKNLTVEDVIEEGAANQHRYKAEPTFSKTGIGHLSPRSIEDSAREAERSMALTGNVTKRLRKTEKAGGKKS